MADITDSGRTIEQHAKEMFYAGQQSGSSLDVFIQDQDTPPFQYFLMNEQKDDISLVSGTAVGDEVIYVNAGHGFTASGEYISIREGSLYTQSRVRAVVSDNITIDAPVSTAYSTAATVVRGIVDMNISGSVSSALFTLPMWGETPVDIQTVKVTMQHTTAGDDSKFGDISELANGLLFKKADDNLTQNLGDYHSNQDFREFGADVEYQQKAGGGNHSTNVTFDIKKTYGVVIRLDPRINTVMSALVQDNLNDLLRLRTSCMGQFTLGE